MLHSFVGYTGPLGNSNGNFVGYSRQDRALFESCRAKLIWNSERALVFPPFNIEVPMKRAALKGKSCLENVVSFWVQFPLVAID